MRDADPWGGFLSKGMVTVGAWAGLVFVAVTADVVRSGPVTRAEQSVEWRRTGLVAPWTLVTGLGDRPSLAAMTATAGLAASARHRSALALLPPVATVVVGSSIRWALSRVIQRERPSPKLWLVDVDGPSFPSRHATAATLGALVLHRSLPRSAAMDLMLGAGVAVVALSRVRLGVHWPSDVVAGIALALAVDAAPSSTLMGRPTCVGRTLSIDSQEAI